MGWIPIIYVAIVVIRCLGDSCYGRFMKNPNSLVIIQIILTAFSCITTRFETLSERQMNFSLHAVLQHSSSRGLCITTAVALLCSSQ